MQFNTKKVTYLTFWGLTMLGIGISNTLYGSDELSPVKALEILGIKDPNRVVTVQEITKAYRKQAFKFHPDRNPDNKEEATENFKKLVKAYAIFQEEGTVEDYNPDALKWRQWTWDTWSKKNQGAPTFSNFEDFLDTFFNSHAGSSKKQGNQEIFGNVQNQYQEALKKMKEAFKELVIPWRALDEIKNSKTNRVTLQKVVDQVNANRINLLEVVSKELEQNDIFFEKMSQSISNLNPDDFASEIIAESLLKSVILSSITKNYLLPAKKELEKALNFLNSKFNSLRSLKEEVKEETEANWHQMIATSKEKMIAIILDEYANTLDSMNIESFKSIKVSSGFCSKLNSIKRQIISEVNLIKSVKTKLKATTVEKCVKKAKTSYKKEALAMQATINQLAIPKEILEQISNGSITNGTPQNSNDRNSISRNIKVINESIQKLRESTLNNEKQYDFLLANKIQRFSDSDKKKYFKNLNTDLALTNLNTHYLLPAQKSFKEALNHFTKECNKLPTFNELPQNMYQYLKDQAIDQKSSSLESILKRYASLLSSIGSYDFTNSPSETIPYVKRIKGDSGIIQVLKNITKRITDNVESYIRNVDYYKKQEASELQNPPKQIVTNQSDDNTINSANNSSDKQKREKKKKENAEKKYKTMLNSYKNAYTKIAEKIKEFLPKLAIPNATLNEIKNSKINHETLQKVANKVEKSRLNLVKVIQEEMKKYDSFLKKGSHSTSSLEEIFFSIDKKMLAKAQSLKDMTLEYLPRAKKELEEELNFLNTSFTSLTNLNQPKKAIKEKWQKMVATSKAKILGIILSEYANTLNALNMNNVESSSTASGFSSKLNNIKSQITSKVNLIKYLLNFLNTSVTAPPTQNESLKAMQEKWKQKIKISKEKILEMILSENANILNSMSTNSFKSSKTDSEFNSKTENIKSQIMSEVNLVKSLQTKLKETTVNNFKKEEKKYISLENCVKEVKTSYEKKALAMQATINQLSIPKEILKQIDNGSIENSNHIQTHIKAINESIQKLKESIVSNEQQYDFFLKNSQSFSNSNKKKYFKKLNTHLALTNLETHYLLPAQKSFTEALNHFTKEFNKLPTINQSPKNSYQNWKKNVIKMKGFYLEAILGRYAHVLSSIDSYDFTKSPNETVPYVKMISNYGGITLVLKEITSKISNTVNGLKKEASNLQNSVTSSPYSTQNYPPVQPTEHSNSLNERAINSSSLPQNKQSTPLGQTVTQDNDTSLNKPQNSTSDLPQNIQSTPLAQTVTKHSDTLNKPDTTTSDLPQNQKRNLDIGNIMIICVLVIVVGLGGYIFYRFKVSKKKQVT